MIWLVDCWIGLGMKQLTLAAMGFKRYAKSRRVDVERGESFGFLGFGFRYLRGLRGVMRPHYTSKLKKRTALWSFELGRSAGADPRRRLRAARCITTATATSTRQLAALPSPTFRSCRSSTGR
jgi:hypothetical protein